MLLSCLVADSLMVGALRQIGTPLAARYGNDEDQAHWSAMTYDKVEPPIARWWAHV